MPTVKSKYCSTLENVEEFCVPWNQIPQDSILYVKKEFILLVGNFSSDFSKMSGNGGACL